MWEILVVVTLLKGTAVFTAPKSYEDSHACERAVTKLANLARRKNRIELTCRQRDWRQA